MSFIFFLVRSLSFSHAPVPSLLRRGASPSLPLYLETLCRECMETKTTSSF